ncbi:winged helix-turn-helix domain-containing protein [Streptomyces sp. NPDC087903]|uniref:winged helix-turn-helix domain-containing protein n=1 Tax=Streptomyces sp. NPDC087903 TaxID=3365819 RepID=UPI003825E1E9
MADDLRAAIAVGRFAPGEKLKSENELREQYGTTRVTVRKALSLLKADGLLHAECRRTQDVFLPRAAGILPAPRCGCACHGITDDSEGG